MAAFEGISESLLPRGVTLYRGKVRDVVDAGDHLVLVTSDRISAFDRHLGVLEGKGEILTQLSLYWFRQTRDIVENHIIKEISPRIISVYKAKVVPIEVIVRGYLTGSAWREYAAGRLVPGLEAPTGMRAHEKLPRPVVTPTTKETVGEHDQPIGRDAIVERGLTTSEVWAAIERKALALYARGQQLLEARGLILVDTKYEFGFVEGRLVLVDEIHTPDSSRFWFADDYKISFAEGREPRKLDKEFLRSWLASQGFTGDGAVPVIPPEIFEETLRRYREVYELITGEIWRGKNLSPEAEMRFLLSSLSG